MSSTIATSARTESIAWNRLPVAALVAAGASAVVNVLIYLIGGALGAFPGDVFIQPGQTLTIVPVIISSIIGAIGGTAVFAALARFTRRPITLFRIIAAVMLVLSFVTPFSISGAPVAMIIALELMHIATAAIVVWALTTLTRRA